MPPSKITDLIQRLHIQRRALRVIQRLSLQPTLAASGVDPLEEFSEVTWPVGAEVFQDIGQGRCGHGDLEQVVDAGDHAIVGSRLAAKR